MKNPFETEKNHTRKFIDSACAEMFTNLKTLVNNYDEKEVDQWFEKNKLYLNDKAKNNLSKAIGNETYYFSIISYNMKKEEIEKLTVLQQLILLKHFKLEDQLIILTQDFDLESPSIFELLYKTAKKEKKEHKLYTSRIVIDAIFKLFATENFDKCEKIEKAINKNIDDLKNKMIVFSRETESSYYSNLNNEYYITDEIILNYSENKKNFILSRHKILPSKEKALQLLDDIDQFYKKKDWETSFDRQKFNILSESIQQYIKCKMHYDLDNTLNSNSPHFKKHKI